MRALVLTVPGGRLVLGGLAPIRMLVQDAGSGGVPAFQVQVPTHMKAGLVPGDRPEPDDGAPEAAPMPVSWAGAGSTRTRAGPVRVRKCTGEPWRDDGAGSGAAHGGTLAVLVSLRILVALVRAGMRAALVPFRTEGDAVAAALE